MAQILTLQNYLRSLFKRGELREHQHKNLRSKNARAGCAHVLPKNPQNFYSVNC